MKETKNDSEKRNRKIAFEIIYYSKRILLCLILFFIYYLVIYNNYYIDFAHNYPIYEMDWFLKKHLEFHTFLDFIFHGFFVVLIITILFHRQIRSAFKWLKKYSTNN